MTVIDATTLDAPAAERRAERIRLRLDSIADNYTAVLPMIREAIEKRDDVTLGYRSPGEYVADRFGGALTNLGIEVRREVVRELTSAGMSTRAIAPVVGTSHETVRADAGVKGLTPARAEAEEGANGLHPAINPETGEVADGYPEPPAAAPTPVTGLDGKTYTRPEPKPAAEPRATPRRPLADTFWNAVYDLGKKAESVHRLTEDDRFPQNAEKVAAIHRNDLIRYRDLLSEVINRLPSA